MNFLTSLKCGTDCIPGWNLLGQNPVGLCLSLSATAVSSLPATKLSDLAQAQPMTASKGHTHILLVYSKCSKGCYDDISIHLYDTF